MEQAKDIYGMPAWYPRFSANALPASFVYLQENEIQSLAEGDSRGDVLDSILPRLERAMEQYGYNRFVSVDTVAPTDTERFKSKRGAVRSARSAWRILTESHKVREAAKNGDVTAICVRPFRRIEVAREFRLFIKDRKLKAMSQYWLIRHFARLQGTQEHYWDMAHHFIEDNAWMLPVDDIVMDVYFTSSGRILVMDLNPFGPPTDPLMLNSWKQNWNVFPGIKIVPPPHRISGDINVNP